MHGGLLELKGYVLYLPETGTNAKFCWRFTGMAFDVSVPKAGLLLRSLKLSVHTWSTAVRTDKLLI
jgi:hypothetical protein